MSEDDLTHEKFSLEHLLSSVDKLQCDNDMFVCMCACRRPRGGADVPAVPTCFVFKKTLWFCFPVSGRRG